MWDDFSESLMACSSGTHIQVGDLFDSFIVPPEVVLQAVKFYKLAAEANPETLYVVYRGNHDASRDAQKSSSFDLFQALLKGQDRIWVCTDVCVIGACSEKENYKIGIIPWHPFKSAAELVQELADNGTDYRAVFGHFDEKSYGGSEFNVIPYEVLSKFTDHVVTGHIHTANDYTGPGGMRVTITGSMQPYSHGEDPNGEFYVTIPLADLINNPNGFKDKNIRVLVKPGDEVPEVDCLSMVLKNVEVADEETEGDIEVELGDFDIDKIFSNCLGENGVGSSVAEKIQNKFKELRNN